MKRLLFKMPNKRQILEILSRALLLEIARSFELPGLTAKPKDEILGSIMGKRSISAEEILQTLKVSDLKEICREFSITAGSAGKNDLILKIVDSGDLIVDSKKNRKKLSADILQLPTNHSQLNTGFKMSKNDATGKPIEQYTHEHEERLNNPPVGLVTPQTDKDGAKKKYEYDPHLDPQLQWAGKAEHTSFEVPTVSLHVHERIDPKRIIEQVKKVDSDELRVDSEQMSLFETQEKRPLREAVEFYKHKDGWTNRLIAGDSLLVMNSMIEKEGLGGKVQMVYFDPPYGIKYGSNFQPFINKKDVKDGKDDDLSSEPEMLKAFRDTWELGNHSYLTYIRDRLLLAKNLLSESGSIFVQISDENLHHIRELLDEVFGSNNFVALIAFAKTSAFATNLLSRNHDYLLWYSSNKLSCKYRQLYLPRIERTEGGTFNWVEDAKGNCRRMTNEEKEDKSNIKGRAFRASDVTSSGESDAGSSPFEFEGQKFRPASGNHWKTSTDGLHNLVKARRIMINGNNLAYKRYESDFPYMVISDVWEDTIIGTFTNKIYVVQTGILAIKRCLLMSTDPGDLVLDITCGSGTTAYVAEQWGRRWITCDTSRVAITLAKQRLMSATYDYYQLAQPSEGISSGFKYKTVPHITLKSIANNEPAAQETLYDQPFTDTKRKRVSGPFTVEAVPAPTVLSFDSAVDGSELKTNNYPLSTSLSRSGETLRQSEWREELLRTGVRGKNGQYIMFSRIEPLSGTRYIQAEGETVVDSDELVVDSKKKIAREKLTTKHSPLTTKKVLICFGPEHAPLEQRTVEEAWQEARPFKPDILLFCTFQFDEEAAKDIDELKPEVTGMQLLKVQMNADLLTDDLRKKRSSNESFWLIGQPEIQVDSGEWLVDSYGKVVMDYGICKELSGSDSLAEINRISPKDLSVYAAISERRDLWTHVANAKSGSIDSVEHSGRPGTEQQGRIRTISGNSEGVVIGIGDANNFVREIKSASKTERRRITDVLRRNKQIIERSSQITIHSPLTTKNFFQVEVHGFDYYNPKTGNVESGGKNQIAMWMLDTDYDNRSLFPSQIFFPMAGANEGWSTLAKNLRAEIDEEKIEAFRGTVSLPFELGNRKQVAVKIVDDRGIESLKIIRI
jgi:adenine-specific DNA-methyltransferase